MATIWIDLENTPHVPFFAPIIRRLEKDGFTALITARDFAQTVELVNHHGLDATVIGGEYGKKTMPKVIGLLRRAISLRAFLRGKEVSLAVGHGSRGLVLAAKLAGIPSLTLYDYEGASVGLFNRMSTYVMTPEAVGKKLIASGMIRSNKLYTYPGLKEEVYVASFSPDEAIIKEFSIDTTKIIVTVRPPSETAHYRSQASTQLFESILLLLKDRNDVQLIISARTTAQRARLTNEMKDWLNVIIPRVAFDGLNLLYHSDLLIGGGGTMNREAAALGVPVASVFKGEQGAIDADLMRQGKIIELSRADEILPLLKKRSMAGAQSRSLGVLDKIIATIEQIAFDSE